MHMSKSLKKTIFLVVVLVMAIMFFLFFKSPTITGKAVTITKADLPEDVLSTGYYAIDASFTKKVSYDPEDYIRIEEYVRKSDGLIGIVKQNENGGGSLDDSIKIAIEDLNNKQSDFNFKEGACQGDEMLSETTLDVIEQRTRRFCVESSKKILYYDKVSKKLSYSRLQYKFAIFFADATPPEKVQNIITYDLKGAEDKIILMWDKNLEDDIGSYDIYYSDGKISDRSSDELENPVDAKNRPNKLNLLISDQEQHVFFDPNADPECEKIDVTYCNYRYDLGDEKIQLEEKKLYYLSSLNKYLAILNIEDKRSNEFLINAVDYSSNRRDNDKLPLAFYSGTSIDDLGPSNIRKAPEVNVLTDYIEVKVEKPVYNVDKSDLFDLTFFAFFISQSSFDDLQGMTPIIELNLEKKGCYQIDTMCTLSIPLDKLPKDKEFYLGVAGVDEAENYYEKIVFPTKVPAIPSVTD